MTGRTILRYFFLLTLFLNTSSFAVKGNITEEKTDSTSESILHLRKLYAANKIIPQEFEKEILTSLSHYPELSNARIEFCYANIFTTMKAVPSMGFLFQKKENRTYRIVMNKKQCGGTNIMQRVNSNALVGVLGHELGHIKDYSQRSNFQLLKLLISYISKKGRIQTEKRVDKITIDRNLGEELLEFNNHVHQDECMDPKYIKYKRKFYNSSSSLSTIINEQTESNSF